MRSSLWYEAFIWENADVIPLRDEDAQANPEGAGPSSGASMRKVMRTVREVQHHLAMRDARKRLP